LKNKNLSFPDKWILTVVLIWSFNTPIMKTIYNSMSPYVYTSLRFSIIATWSLFHFYFIAKEKALFKLEKSAVPSIFWGGICAYFSYQVCIIEGLFNTPIFLASVLISSSPLFSAILAIIFKIEKVTWKTWLGLILALSGIVIFKSEYAQGLNIFDSNWYGELFCLGSALSWSAYSIIAKTEKFKIYSYNKTNTLMLLLSSSLLILYTISDIQIFNYSSIGLSTWAMIWYSIIFGIIIAYKMYFKSVQILGVEKTVIYINLVPILAGFISIGLGIEEFTFLKLVGSLFVIGGTIIVRK
jgi:drug/metabolite transporter (DMT)-like permease